MLRKTLLSLTLLILIHNAYAQAPDDAMAKLQKGFDLYGQKQFSPALQEFNSILSGNPEHSDAMMGAGICYVDMGNYTDGRKFLEQAHYIEPFNHTILRCLAYLEILEKKDLAKAKERITKAMMAFGNSNEIQLVASDCDDYGKTSSPDLFNALKEFAAQRYQQTSGLQINKTVRLFEEGMSRVQASDPKGAKVKFDQILTMMKASPDASKEFVFRLYHLYAQWMLSANAHEEAGTYLKDGYSYYFSSGVNHPYQLTQLAKNLCRHYIAFGEINKVLAVADKVIPISQQQPYVISTADLLLEKINARYTLYTGANDNSQSAPLISETNTLLQIAEKCGSFKQYFQAHANNTLCATYLLSPNTADRRMAMGYGEKALALARANNLEQLVGSIQANLTVLYFQNREYAKASAMSRDVIADHKRNQRYLDAALTLNNLGSMLFYTAKYDEASAAFKEAVQLVEDFRAQVPVTSRVPFLQQQISAYQFLMMCYAKTENVNGLYEAFEKTRSRQLSERIALGKNLTTASPQWVQQNLNPDEAVLMYGMGEPGAIALLVITSNQIKSIYQEVPDFHEKLQQRFQEGYGYAMKLREQSAVHVDPFELQKSDDISKVVSLLRTMINRNDGSIAKYDQINKDLLATFYQLLIQPATNYLQGKKKVFISPDSYLSFIPFDALIDQQGKYLAEKLDVQYVPSMTVLKLIKSRSFPRTRKNMLAFGGAIFEPYVSTAAPLSSIEDFYQLQYQVSENTRYNVSQRKAYATLGVTGQSWTYLPGTLAEVNGINSTVKDVTVYTGKDFTENFIKKLSASGELAQYKVLHLASHGMVVPSVPELSAVITGLPLAENAGQDGYLTVEEVKSLKLQADFVALSACETGLGKIYAGEGVIGLTQSFLEAGTNAISVSLWAVSDDATMKFMVGLYDLVNNKNMKYAEAMAEMKRKFIRGEFGELYKYPNFWAPFAYYGN